MIYSRTFKPAPSMCCQACVFGQDEHEPWCKAPFRAGDVLTVPPTEPCLTCGGRVRQPDDDRWMRFVKCPTCGEFSISPDRR